MDGVLTDGKRLKTLTQRDRELNSWAIRSFRDVADGDYIAARMACRAQLPVQFLWASEQALERYLKFILFLRRIPARKVNHDLRCAPALTASAGLDLELSEGSRKFVEKSRTWGSTATGGIVSC